MVPVSVFLGGGIGFVLEARYLRFEAGGVWWKRVLRYLLGSLVLIVLFFGLGAAFEYRNPVALFTLIQFGLIGFWVGYGAPWLFVKAGLVDCRPQKAG